MLVNRIGDFCLLIGIFFIYTNYNSFDYNTINILTPFFKGNVLNFLNCKIQVLTIIGIFLFLGAVGKSAQITLHT
jgi:NADH-quinone oxidoreductase subunit L